MKILDRVEEILDMTHSFKIFIASAGFVVFWAFRERKNFPV